MQRIFYFIALPSSLIMLIQTVMLFFGTDGSSHGIGMESEVSGIEDGGDGGLNGDGADGGGGESESESSSQGLRFVTTRGVVAFLTVAGWTGILCMELRLPPIIAGLIAAVCGFGAMVGIAYLIQRLMGLSSVGTMDYRTALGSHAEVYLRIPGEGGMGKVSVTINGAYRECDAVSEDGSPIGTGQTVRVTDILRDGVLVVEPAGAVISAPVTDESRMN